MSKIYLSTVVLLQQMILKFLVCGSCAKKSKCIAIKKGDKCMVHHEAQTIHYDNEENSKFKGVYAHFKTNL